MAVEGGTLLSLAVAVTLRLPTGGGESGAVYAPVVELIVPQAPVTEEPQLILQVTAMGLPLTVAVNVCCPPAGSVTVEGVTARAAVGVDGAVTVTPALAVFVVSAWAIALTVTVAGVGTTFGAVYTPVVEIKPTVVVPPATPFTCQVTAVLVLFVTVAVNCCVWLVVTDAESGEIVIVTSVLEELLPPPHAVKTVNSAHTTTDEIARFIHHSWVTLNDCCSATRLLGIICPGPSPVQARSPSRTLSRSINPTCCRATRPV
jgi:hypothetical protein